MYLMKRAKSVLYHGKPCPFCNRPMDHDDRHLQPTRDHYPVPYSKGGRRTVICCYVCNNHKSDMTAAEWHAYMAATPAWWLLTKQERKQRRAASKEIARTEKWGPRYVETEVDLYRGRPSRNRKPHSRPSTRTANIYFASRRKRTNGAWMNIQRGRHSPPPTNGREDAV